MSNLKINQHLVKYVRQAVPIAPKCTHGHRQEDKFCHLCGANLEPQYETKTVPTFLSKRITQKERSEYDKFDQFLYNYELTLSYGGDFGKTYQLKLPIYLSCRQAYEQNYKEASVIAVHFQSEFLDWLSGRFGFDTQDIINIESIQDTFYRKLYDSFKWNIIDDIRRQLKNEIETTNSQSKPEFWIGNVGVVTEEDIFNRD